MNTKSYYISYCLGVDSDIEKVILKDSTSNHFQEFIAWIVSLGATSIAIDIYEH